MRLAYTVLGATVGGAELHAFDLARRMAARGHEVHLVMRSGLQVGGHSRALEVHDASSYGELARVLTRVRPDVVQHFNSLLAVAGIELCAPRPVSIEVIHANHALEPDYRPTPTDATDLVVAVSASAARFYPPPDRPLRVILNGVDLRAFSPTFVAEDQPVRIATVGRLEASSKRVFDALDAAATLPRSAFTLVLVGEGPARAELEARIAAEALPARLLGQQTDMPAIYRGVEVLLSVSPSEGFGLAIAEAAACGLAIVARRCHGITESMRDGVELLLADTVEELAIALRRVVEDRGLRARLGTAARAWAEAHLDVERMVSAYEAVYQEWAR